MTYWYSKFNPQPKFEAQVMQAVQARRKVPHGGAANSADTSVRSQLGTRGTNFCNNWQPVRQILRAVLKKTVLGADTNARPRPRARTTSSSDNWSRLTEMIAGTSHHKHTDQKLSWASTNSIKSATISQCLELLPAMTTTGATTSPVRQCVSE